jgi:hypothetical protein
MTTIMQENRESISFGQEYLETAHHKFSSRGLDSTTQRFLWSQCKKNSPANLVKADRAGFYCSCSKGRLNFSRCKLEGFVVQVHHQSPATEPHVSDDPADAAFDIGLGDPDIRLCGVPHAPSRAYKVFLVDQGFANEEPEYRTSVISATLERTPVLAQTPPQCRDRTGPHRMCSDTGYPRAALPCV